MSGGTVPQPRLRWRDLLGASALAARAKPIRTALTMLGIALGIAAITAVLGISTSGRADLLADLDRLGTDLLRVQAGQTLTGERSRLPDAATKMLDRLPAVDRAAATSPVDATVRRSDLIPESRTGGIAVLATDGNLAPALGASAASGRLLNAADQGLPGVVLGAVAAERLGIRTLDPLPRVIIGRTWFSVVGILERDDLLPEIERAALIGRDIAETLFGADLAPGTIYLRAAPDAIEAVRRRIPRTANPEHPNEVTVSRPSDVLRAKAIADASFSRLVVGLGAVALIVGGVGIANVMVISVMERRSEIGLRRALGATRTHIRLQFMLEAVLLSGAGGLLGVAIGTAVTAGQSWLTSSVVALPAEQFAGALAATVVIGLLAGIYPATRAARLDPAVALRPGAR